MQVTWRNKRTPFEVIAALTDFARLSQQASALLSAPLETPDTLALKMLTRLISLCHASAGTFVLSFQLPDITRRSLAVALTDSHMFPLVMRYKMNEEEVAAALTLFSIEGPDIQIPEGMPQTLIWRRLIKMQSDEEHYHLPEASLEQIDSRSTSRPAPLACVFFLLRWSGADQKTAIQALSSEQELLPLMADAVDAVIVNVLLALRVQDLEQLAQRKAQQNSELLKAELLATVSHELRSPLASIKGYTTTLLRHEQRISPEERHEFLLAINGASAQLETIVDRLLEVSQLETKTVRFEPIAINLIHLVQEALTAARRFVGGEEASRDGPEQHHVRYTLHIEQEYTSTSGDGLIIQGDRRLLRNLLDHLLENATHYSPPDGKVEVGLRSIQCSQALAALEQQWQQRKSTIVVLPSKNRRDVPQAEIWVKDVGSGIAAEHLQHIFDRFYRVDMSLIRDVNGLGLGLSICKSIVELHEGTIWVESEVGKGSTFHVLLPKHEYATQMIEEIV